MTRIPVAFAMLALNAAAVTLAQPTGLGDAVAAYTRTRTTDTSHALARALTLDRSVVKSGDISLDAFPEVQPALSEYSRSYSVRLRHESILSRAQQEMALGPPVGGPIGPPWSVAEIAALRDELETLRSDEAKSLEALDMAVASISIDPGSPDLDEFPSPSAAITRGRVFIVFAPSASPHDVQRILSTFQLRISSVFADINMLFADMTDASTPTTIAALLGKVRMDPTVTAAGPDRVLNAALIPPATASLTLDTGLRINSGWADTTLSDASASYWLRAGRFPQAWNVVSAQAAPGAHSVPVGIVDIGFGSNNAVSISEVCDYGSVINAHGLHVAGIIAANPDALLVAGGIPRGATLLACSIPLFESSGGLATNHATMETATIMLDTLLSLTPPPRLINLSIGYDWGGAFDPRTAPDLLDDLRADGVVYRHLAHKAEAKGVILVSAAGNDSHFGVVPDRLDSQFGSPVNWAAVNRGGLSTPAHNVVIVEATNAAGTNLLDRSNARACVSAPGSRIVSTVPGAKTLSQMSGTSMAAPQVTAALALLLLCDPSIALGDAISSIIGMSGDCLSASSPAPRLDAFGILFRGCKRAAHLVSDLNVDGTVDMADFAILRSATLQTEGDPAIVPQDLNGDGTVDQHENVFPRADLNGDGSVSRTATAVVPGFPAPVSDIQIMMSAWEDPQVPVGSLPALLNSP